MIIVSIFSLIPEAYTYLNNKTLNSIILIILLINIGFIISQVIDTFIDKIINNTSLYKLGILSSITLIIHNIPEGIITFLTTSNNLSLGITTSISIALHNIPEGIAIAVPIYYATNSRKKAFLYTFITGFSEFLGSIIALIFLNKLFIINLSIILGLTAGIMLHLSIFKILPKSLEFNNVKLSTLGFITGFIMIIICLILI